jgi:hypothetical protein
LLNNGGASAPLEYKTKTKEHDRMMIGKRAYGIDGAGQAARKGLAGREGEIIGIESDRWGTWILVKWDGQAEPESYSSHTVKPTTEQNGIGVYYEA